MSRIASTIVGFVTFLVFGCTIAFGDTVVAYSGNAPATNENTPISFSISGLVSAQDPITAYTILSGFGPSHGSIQAAGPLGLLSYTPDNYFFGSDQFAFTATDSNGDVSNPAFVYLTVKEVALPPIVQLGTFSTTVDTPLEIALSLLATPTNGVPISRYLIGTPSHGTVVGFDASTGVFDYVPNTGFQGADEFAWGAEAANGLQADNYLVIGVGPSSPASVPEPTTFVLVGTPMIAWFSRRVRARFTRKLPS